jgi:hypothetical protein
MAVDMWQNKEKLGLEQQANLVKPFTIGEVEQALKDMKTETTPGLDGFPVVFYKKFRGLLKWWIM